MSKTYCAYCSEEVEVYLEDNIAICPEHGVIDLKETTIDKSLIVVTEALEDYEYNEFGEEIINKANDPVDAERIIKRNKEVKH